LAPLLDLWYSWWLPSVSLSIAFFCAFPQDRMRRQFMLSCVLLWTLGAWIYVALPALGPVYVYNDVWSGASDQIYHATGAQQLLWENYQTVLGGRTGGLRQFNPTRGVAAMPSLHVGAHWLLMLWFRRRARPFFAVAVIGTLLTFIASVVTGWHYAVDGYVGVVLAQCCYLISLRLDRPKSARPPKQPPIKASADTPAASRHP
jgi:membrane-associated phospholipid phosphatase